MNDNYSQWLIPNEEYEDQILWELLDACKLIAGYVPYFDDNQHLNIELVAQNNRNIATMRSILGDFETDGKKHVRMAVYISPRKNKPKLRKVQRNFVYALDFVKWAKAMGYEVPSNIVNALHTTIKDIQISYKNSEPWLVHNSNDPEPTQKWYIAARYFARLIISEDPSLLRKRNLLTNKISSKMFDAGVYGRFKNKKINPDTIKKALSNVNLEENSQTLV